jgi:hypothetical protein
MACERDSKLREGHPLPCSQPGSLRPSGHLRCASYATPVAPVGMSHFSRSAWQQKKEHRRLACEIHSRGKLTDDQPLPAPARSGRPCPLLSSAAARLTFHISIPKILPHCGNTPFAWQEKYLRKIEKRLQTQEGGIRRPSTNSQNEKNLYHFPSR